MLYFLMTPDELNAEWLNRGDASHEKYCYLANAYLCAGKNP